MWRAGAEGLSPPSDEEAFSGEAAGNRAVARFRIPEPGAPDRAKGFEVVPALES